MYERFKGNRCSYATDDRGRKRTKRGKGSPPQKERKMRDRRMIGQRGHGNERDSKAVNTTEGHCASCVDSCTCPCLWTLCTGNGEGIREIVVSQLVGEKGREECEGVERISESRTL